MTVTARSYIGGLPTFLVFQIRFSQPPVLSGSVGQRITYRLGSITSNVSRNSVSSAALARRHALRAIAPLLSQVALKLSSLGESIFYITVQGDDIIVSQTVASTGIPNFDEIVQKEMERVILRYAEVFGPIFFRAYLRTIVRAAIN